MKYENLLLPAAGILLLAGCSSNSSRLNETSVQLMPMKSCVKYEIVGETEGHSSTGVLFGFIKFGESKSGTFHDDTSSFFSATDETRAAARYNAIENADNADSILAPRYTEEAKGFWPIFYTKKATVKGKAIKYSKTDCSK